MRRAFTLIEVNLAMLIMAGGILSIVGLYAFGYRENRQSREDVAATAMADAILGQLTMALTATNLKWSVFKDIENWPGEDGWGEYFDKNTGLVTQNPTGKAKDAFSQTMKKLESASAGSPLFEASLDEQVISATGLGFGLVILHEKDSPIVRMGLRATRQPGTLLSMPLFYTEARFQGVPE